jgi:2-phospho-L-lactate transferase/gluconeogenesis factor (CofD/UPF0052 family)
MFYSAYDHVAAIHRHAGKGTIEKVILNSTPLKGAQRRLYAAGKVYPVEQDSPRITDEGIEVVWRPLLAKSEKVRHDSRALAQVCLELAGAGRARKQPGG